MALLIQNYEQFDKFGQDQGKIVISAKRGREELRHWLFFFDTDRHLTAKAIDEVVVNGSNWMLWPESMHFSRNGNCMYVFGSFVDSGQLFVEAVPNPLNGSSCYD